MGQEAVAGVLTGNIDVTCKAWGGWSRGGVGPGSAHGGSGRDEVAGATASVPWSLAQR